MKHLPTDFWEWIAAHQTDDPARLRLKFGRDRGLEILQIEARRKYGAKFEGLFDRLPYFVVPNSLSPEQSTSSALARFHASLVAEGSTVADLTAGMGIDVLALSDRCRSVTAVEIDHDIARTLELNFSGFRHISVVEQDCRDFVADCISKDAHFDAIFIDPARRGDSGQRLYALDQCNPNVVDMLPDLLALAPLIIIKASPMLDIAHTLQLLPQAHALYTVGTTTECKELIVECRRGEPIANPTITAVTISASGRVGEMSFSRREEADASPRFAVPKVGDWIYDPYPAVMKAAPWNLLCRRYGVAQLGPNTRLWTSQDRVDSFPGHAFRVTEVLPYASRHIKRYAASHPRVSITARNFDIDAAALRRKLGVKDGPERLFAVRGLNDDKFLITAEP